MNGYPGIRGFCYLGYLGTSYNGTKLREIVVKRAACLAAKSTIFPTTRHLVQPLKQCNMLNLVPLGTSYIFLRVEMTATH
jgi:hypothetical protein